MKVAILGESEVDEIATRILVDGVLGLETQKASYPPLRTRGWKAILKVIKSTIRFLHYHSDADAFVAVIDSDLTPVHSMGHEEKPNKKCRLCQIRHLISEVIPSLRIYQGRAPIKTAVGLAVPALEAWLRFGHDPHVTEPAWFQGLQTGTFPYEKNKLKRQVYGAEITSISTRKQVAARESRRLVENLADFEQAFPNGFGSLARDIRGW